MERILDKKAYRKLVIIRLLKRYEGIGIEKNLLYQQLDCTRITADRSIAELQEEATDNGMDIIETKSTISGVFTEDFSVRPILRRYLEDALVYQIIKAIFLDEFVDINTFSTRHYVSYASTYRALMDIKAFVKAYDVRLIVTPRVEIMGPEKNVRLFYLDFFSSLKLDDWLFYDIDQNMVQYYLKRLSFAGQSLIELFNRSEIEMLEWFVAICVVRMEQGHLIENDYQEFLNRDIYRQLDDDKGLGILLPEDSSDLTLYEMEKERYYCKFFILLQLTFVISEDNKENTLRETLALKMWKKDAEYVEMTNQWWEAVSAIFPLNRLGQEQQQVMRYNLDQMHLESLYFNNVQRIFMPDLDLLSIYQRDLQFWDRFLNWSSEWLTKGAGKIFKNNRLYLQDRYVLLLSGVQFALSEPKKICVSTSFSYAVDQQLKQEICHYLFYQKIEFTNNPESADCVIVDNEIPNVSIDKQVFIALFPSKFDFEQIAKKIMLKID